MFYEDTDRLNLSREEEIILNLGLHESYTQAKSVESEEFSDTVTIDSINDALDMHLATSSKKDQTNPTMVLLGDEGEKNLL
jgi:hypothetical protein